MNRAMYNINRQSGVVLVVSLMMLVVMTLIGVTAMRGSNLEEKMAGNSRDRQLALQSAEAALRAGERTIEGNELNLSFTTSCSNGLCDCSDSSTCVKEVWFDNTLDVWNDNAKHITYGGTIGTVNTQAKYIIEFLGRLDNTSTNPSGVAGCPGCPRMYRITSRGTGLTDNSVVMLQVTYRKD